MYTIYVELNSILNIVISEPIEHGNNTWIFTQRTGDHLEVRSSTRNSNSNFLSIIAKLIENLDHFGIYRISILFYYSILLYIAVRNMLFYFII